MRYSASEKLEIIRLVNNPTCRFVARYGRPGRDGAYAALVSQPPKFDQARTKAQRGGGFIGGRLHDQREPPNRDRNRTATSPAHRRQHREAAGAPAWAPPIKSEA